MDEGHCAAHRRTRQNGEPYKSILLPMGPIKEVGDEGYSPCNDVDRDVEKADIPIAIARIIEGRNGRKGHVDTDTCEIQHQCALVDF
jgi:hypothetical protein